MNGKDDAVSLSMKSYYLCLILPF